MNNGDNKWFDAYTIGIDLAEADELSPYCKPQWINNYLGWCASKCQHPESNCYIGLYIKDLEELTNSTWLEF